MIQWIVTIWSLVPLPFLNPIWTSGSSQFTYCWSLAWRLLSIALPACEMSARADLFQPCGHYWVFQICWHTECSIFTASSFRIWNSLTGIPSPPLALFAVMLPKAQLTLISRMSGWLALGEWSHHHGYLCHEDLFLYSSSVIYLIKTLNFDREGRSGGKKPSI